MKLKIYKIIKIINKINEKINDYYFHNLIMIKI